MSQKQVKINNTVMAQPFSMKYSLETTDSATTTRTINGKIKGTPLFVVEAYNVTYQRLTPQQTSELLQAIIRCPAHPKFSLYAYSPYSGTWSTRDFYCTAESLDIQTLKEGFETFNNLSVTFVGMNPVA